MRDFANLLNRLPIVALIYLVFFIVFPVIVYDWVSVRLYRWLYSRGRDH